MTVRARVYIAYVHASMCERECDCVCVWVRLVYDHALQLKKGTVKFQSFI